MQPNDAGFQPQSVISLAPSAPVEKFPDIRSSIIRLEIAFCQYSACTIQIYSMQSVQRRFGKFLPRTADESQVAVLLKDFEDADLMLAKVVSPCYISPYIEASTADWGCRSLTRRKRGETPGGIF